MSRWKYYEGIWRAQAAQPPLSELPAFDFQRLHSKGLASRITSWLLEDPRWALRLLRRWRPVLNVGRFVLVTRNADVRDILERQDEFETPYGPEMTEIARGANFILGMQDGPAYRRMKSSVLSAFPVEEVENVVRPLAARHSQAIMLGAAPGFDVVRDLLKIVPVRLCRDYFGMVVDDETEFANWSIALSALFFADPGASPATREIAVVAADRMIRAVDRSVAAVRDGSVPGDTPLGRLVAMHERNPALLGMDEIRSVMLGMIAGFAPTNLLASGNCLDVILSRPEAQGMLDDAIGRSDNDMLDAVILEAMRFKPIWVGPFRYATRDTVVARRTPYERRIPKHSVVMPSTWSAMFDADAVQDPDTFRIDRSHRDYLVFGHGIHLCIGAAVARVQIAESFRALFSRRNVRRAAGRAGRMKRIGTYPDSLQLDFDADPLCKTVDHALVTIACEVKPSAVLAELRDRVDRLGNPASPALGAALDAAGSIHFASIAVAGSADPATERTGERAHLVVELSGDGSRDEVIAAFTQAVGSDLRELLDAACEIRPDEGMPDFMRRHALEVSPFARSGVGLPFSGTPGHSVRRIKAEAELAELASATVSGLGARHDLGALAILDKVRRLLAADSATHWALAPAESLLEKPAGRARQAASAVLRAPAVWLSVLAILLACWWLTYSQVFRQPNPGDLQALLLMGTALVLTLLGVALTLGVIMGLAVLALLWKESRDRTGAEAIGLGRWEDIVSREDRAAQNNLTAISILKPGLLRRLALRFTLAVIAIAARTVFRPGFLSDIGTIHFARWVVLPGTNKLMFFSNFGGSWESYLEDFITKARQGLTGVWSNTEGFPRTRYLFDEGARDGDSFKRWARLQQIPTLFWYSAYPELSTARIRINSQIRQGLVRASTETEARDWLALFGSLPRPVAEAAQARKAEPAVIPASPEVLETGEIQSIFFGPLGALTRSRMIALRIPADISRPARKAWLEHVVQQVTFGERMPAEKAMIVAFGPVGLARLGLDCCDGDDALASFPLPFRQGMGSATRSRILDDTGDNAPQNWQWGSPDKPVDAVIVCYAKTMAMLRSQVREIERRSKAAGISTVATLPLTVKRVGEVAVEHFGFADGLSQPMVKGTARAVGRVSPMHLLAAGELLLGYRDEHGFYPPTAKVPAGKDRHGCLPHVAEEDAPASLGKTRPRDFGRNGSFLVVRQMEQHVDRFGAYCAAAAKAFDDPAITPDWIAAKMVGRWRDGSSLVRNPGGRRSEKRDGSPSRRPDNDFSYGAEDPQGLRCPLGAHIRRANPRDSLGQDHAQQIGIGKRHRILRVGRTYVKPAPGCKREKGLLFMCLNADLERQYEFVQQTWVASRSFHGLAAEKDPTIGAQNGEGGRFTIPRWEGPLVLQGIPNFVTTRGGGYFFMPSRSALRYLISRL